MNIRNPLRDESGEITELGLIKETDDQGRCLVKITQVAEKLTSFTRYNGGWVKTVKGLDKKRTDGYSIDGSFVPDARYEWITPGLFIDCSIGGSRKNQTKTYTLFEITPDYELNEIAVSKSHSWAVEFWPEIEQRLAIPKPEVVLTDELRQAIVNYKEALAAGETPDSAFHSSGLKACLDL